MKLSRRAVLRQMSAGVAGAAIQVRLPRLNVGSCGPAAPEGFRPFCFETVGGVSRQLYVTGDSGPPVILLHELPGLIDADLEAARKLAVEGFVVVAPLLFGTPGGKGKGLRNVFKVCGEDQFACKKGEITSPHVAWLRQLCGSVREEWPDGKGVGVIGMCLTGAFPIPLLREPSVVAPVLCQPTIPFNAWTRFGWFTDKDALGIDPADLQAAKDRADVPLLGIRFRGDWRCRKERFDRLAREFRGRFFRMDLDGSHHSTLGGDFCPQAFSEVTSFLNQYLRTTPRVGPVAFPHHSRPDALREIAGPGCESPSQHHKVP